MRNPLSKAQTIEGIGRSAENVALSARVAFDNAAKIMIALAVIAVAALCTIAVSVVR
jgi:hypothetical protein